MLLSRYHPSLRNGTVAVMIFYSSFSFAQESDVAAGEQVQSIPVIVEEVSPQKFTLTQDLPGRVSAFRSAEVRARVTGIIEKRTFEEGSKVSEGEELFLIEDESLYATYQARKADLANAEAQYELAVATVNRYKKLRASGTVSRQEFDTFESTARQAKAQVEQAKANAEIARINYQYATVSAPISGRIDMAMVTEGALTSAGTTQLAVIEQIDKVYVDFTRSSSEYQKLRRALSNQEGVNESTNYVQILFDDGSVYEEKGQLEFSSRTINPDTGAITLRAVVDNPNEELLPGMFVRVRVPIATKDNVILVPQKAVKVSEQGTIVHVVENGQLKAINVELGEMTDDAWMITSELESGTRVVVSDTTAVAMMGMPLVGMTKEEQASQYGGNEQGVSTKNESSDSIDSSQ